MRRHETTAILIVFWLSTCLVVALSIGGCQEQSDYERCVSRCLEQARAQNIERDDITNAEYQRIIQEHKAYICPGKCDPHFIDTVLAKAGVPSTATPTQRVASPTPRAVSPTPTRTRSPSPPTPTRTRVVGTPTPVPPRPTPEPTSTATQPPLGTRANPIPRGQKWLASTGWEIVVLDFNPDAWPVVQAENRYNDPPRTGNRMVMARVGVTNVSVERQPGIISKSWFALQGSRNLVYRPFDSPYRCGVIPDELLDEVFIGEYVEGNVCFQIPLDETGLRLIYDPIVDDYTYFAVQ